MWTYGCFGLLVLCLSFWIGDLCNSKTKGIISGLLTASAIYIIGYLTGIIPVTQPADLGLAAMTSLFGLERSAQAVENGAGLSVFAGGHGGSGGRRGHSPVWP